MVRSHEARVVLSALFALSACVIAPPPEPLPERVAVTTAALSATNLVGTSLPARTLALTFDDGPGDRTAAMSSYLAAQGIRAVFFFNGAHIAPTALPNPNGVTPMPNAGALLAQVVADGHLVANHTTTHRDLVGTVLPSGDANVVQEIAETDADIAPYVPTGHLLFRAPYGYYDAGVWNAVRASAMNKYVGPVRWDIGGEPGNYPAQAADWACWQDGLQTGGGGGAKFGVGTEACGDAYLTEIGVVGRGIVLMHDSSASARGSTLAMVQYLVPILKARGYTFVRADQVPAIAALLGPCRICEPGSHQIAACSADADTACAPCAAGSFAAGHGATSCTACGACDDGDACTADTCDRVAGCLHAPIAGCLPDAGLADAAPADAGLADAATASAAPAAPPAPPAPGHPSHVSGALSDASADPGLPVVEGSCGVARGARPALRPRAALVLGLFALLVARRRRARAAPW